MEKATFSKIRVNNVYTEKYRVRMGEVVRLKCLLPIIF